MRCLLNGETCEEPQFDDTTLLRVKGREFVEGFIEREHVDAGRG